MLSKSKSSTWAPLLLLALSAKPSLGNDHHPHSDVYPTTAFSTTTVPVLVTHYVDVTLPHYVNVTTTSTVEVCITVSTTTTLHYTVSTTETDSYTVSTTETDSYTVSTTETDSYTVSTTETDSYTVSTTETDSYTVTTTETDSATITNTETTTTTTTIPETITSYTTTTLLKTEFDPCPKLCSVSAATVHLFFWPSNRPYTYPTTYVNTQLAYTFTSPSVYMLIPTAVGVNAANATVGPSTTDWMLPLDLEEVSTIFEGTSTRQLNLADLGTDCPQTADPTAIATMVDSRCDPILAAPRPVSSWAYPCNACGRFGLFDPPYAVPTITGLIETTTMAPATTVTVVPVPTVTVAPVQTSAPPPPPPPPPPPSSEAAPVPTSEAAPAPTSEAAPVSPPPVPTTTTAALPTTSPVTAAAAKVSGGLAWLLTSIAMTVFLL